MFMWAFLQVGTWKSGVGDGWRCFDCGGGGVLLLKSEAMVRMKSMAVGDGALRHLAQLDADIYGQHRKAVRLVVVRAILVQLPGFISSRRSLSPCRMTISDHCNVTRSVNILYI